jgi:hypothetical protein
MKRVNWTSLIKPLIGLAIGVVVIIVIAKISGAFKSLGSIGSGIFGRSEQEEKASEEAMNAAKNAASNKNSNEPTPTGFNPTVWATKLHNAMNRFGTDTEVIKEASELPKHCRAQIFTAFGQRTYYYNKLNLYDWLVEELDDKETNLYLVKWVF